MWSETLKKNTRTRGSHVATFYTLLLPCLVIVRLFGIRLVPSFFKSKHVTLIIHSHRSTPFNLFLISISSPLSPIPIFPINPLFYLFKMFTESCTLLLLPAKHARVQTHQNKHNPNQPLSLFIKILPSPFLLPLSNLKITPIFLCFSHYQLQLAFFFFLMKPWSFWHSLARHYHSLFIYHP